MNRYDRQTRLPQLGEEAQQRLASSRVLLIGCGALGTVIAEQLVRGGIGTIRICDRDIVELTNLQRQTLFDESDARAGTPKAIAAAARLGAINSEITIEPLAIDVHSGNIEALFDGMNLVIDGTDNAETRYLINDAAVKLNVSWVYGACVGMSGRVMGIVPGRSACLRCLFPDPPAPGELETCDTAGVLASAAAVAASLQVAEALKILVDDPNAAAILISFDLWRTRFREVSTAGARREDCPACGARSFQFLDSPSAGATTLCGRQTVQVRPANAAELNLKLIASRFPSSELNDYFVRGTLRESGLTLTLFPDGRALIHGTSDPAVARSIYARYIGI